MAQITQTVAQGILDGQGYTDNEVRQLAHFWLSARAQADSQPAPVVGRMSPSKEWLETRLAIADDSGVEAGVPPKNARPCDAPPGCNSHNCLECNDYPRAARAPADSVTAPAGGVAPVAIKAMGYGGSTGINDYLMSDGTVKAMRPSEVKWATQAAPTPPAQAADSVLEDAALLQEARTALWQPANVDLCERIDAYLDAARKQGANHD